MLMLPECCVRIKIIRCFSLLDSCVNVVTGVDLYLRLRQFMGGNLLIRNSNLKRDDRITTEDETLSPTTE